MPGSVWEMAGWSFLTQDAAPVMLVESDCETLISLKDGGQVNDRAKFLVLTS